MIGTPLASNATRVMLLGSGELGKELVISLQRLGVEVIAVDRYPNAPAHQVAHRAYVIDMTDPAALRGIIAREKPSPHRRWSNSNRRARRWWFPRRKPRF